jgi:hypothetical protein
MSDLADFFKGSDTRLGLFYPRGYLIAVFANLAAADRARKLLGYAGFAADEVLAASGEDFLRSANERVEREGVWGFLMRELSLFLGTEAEYTHRDLDLAADGAALVAVHAPTRASEHAAWSVLEPLSPIAARLYAAGGIQHLAGDV